MRGAQIRHKRLSSYKYLTFPVNIFLSGLYKKVLVEEV